MPLLMLAEMTRTELLLAGLLAAALLLLLWLLLRKPPGQIGHSRLLGLG